MARNRKVVESVSESGDDERSREEEKSQPQLPVKSQKPPPPPSSQPPSSSEEEESGSETESDSDGADSNVKPLASKRMEEAQNPINGARSKPTAPEAVTPAKPSAAKRPSEDTAASKDSKKSKTIADPEASEKKRKLFERVFSEEDVIVILKGMMEYSSKKECHIDPIVDIDDFHDFIKKSVHKVYTGVQLREKIRKLKAKYKINEWKEKNGEERRLKLHAKRIYELSKEVWGNKNGGEEVVKANGNGSVGRKKKKKGKKEMVVRNGREIYEVEQGVEGEEERRRLRVEELELFLKQLELRVAQTKLLLNAIKGKGGGGDTDLHLQKGYLFSKKMN